MTELNMVQTVIYGTGSVARKLLQSGLITDNESLCFVTSSGEEVMPGYQVFKATYLQKQTFGRLIIASSFVAQILTQLESFGLSRQLIFVYEPDQNCLLPLESLNTNQPVTPLYAIYDLEANSATFDCVFFAATAQAYARKQGCLAIHFVIVPGIHRTGRLGDAGYSLNDEEIYRWKIQSIVIPVFQMVSMFKGLTVLTDRQSNFLADLATEECFPVDYSRADPQDSHHPMVLYRLINDKRVSPQSSHLFSTNHLV